MITLHLLSGTFMIMCSEYISGTSLLLLFYLSTPLDTVTSRFSPIAGGNIADCLAYSFSSNKALLSFAEL